MTLTSGTPGLVPGAPTRGSEMAEKDKKTITLLSDVKLAGPTEDKPDVMGHRGETVTVSIGLANMLVASNQALEGEVKEVKPFPNAKAEAARTAVPKTVTTRDPR